MFLFSNKSIRNESNNAKNYRIYDIILDHEDEELLNQPCRIVQDFYERKSLPNFFVPLPPNNVIRNIYRQELTRAFIGINIDCLRKYSHEPDLNSKFQNTQKTLLSYYNPTNNHETITESTQSPHIPLKPYLYCDNINDSQILLQFFMFKCQPKISQQFEPLFATFALYAFHEGKVMCISESVTWDLTPNLIKENYSFHYSRNIDNSLNTVNVNKSTSDEIGKSTRSPSKFSHSNQSCILNIPNELNHNDVYLLCHISKILTGSNESVISAYQRKIKIDEKKHIEASSRLRNYRQVIGFSIIKVFNEQYQCGNNGGDKITVPVFAMKQSLDKAKLGSLIRDLFPVDQRSLPIPASSLISKCNLNVLEIEFIIRIINKTAVSTSTKIQANSSSSRYNYSGLESIMPKNFDTSSNEANECVSPTFNKPITAQKTTYLKTLLPKCFRFSSDITRLLGTNEVNLLYVYPSKLENFQHRNLSIKLELVEYNSAHGCGVSVIPSIVPHNYLSEIPANSDYSQLLSFIHTTVHYHEYSPELLDEIKIVLPEIVTRNHYIRFTVQHVHVKPKYRENNGRVSMSILSSFMGVSVPKELEPEALDIGVGYLPLLHSIAKISDKNHLSNIFDSYINHFGLIPDQDYFVKITESDDYSPNVQSYYPVTQISKNTNNAPYLRLSTKSLSSFNSSIPSIQKVLHNFPPAIGYMPSCGVEFGADEVQFSREISDVIVNVEELQLKDEDMIKNDSLDFDNVCSIYAMCKDFFSSVSMAPANIHSSINGLNPYANVQYEIKKHFLILFRFLYRLLRHRNTTKAGKKYIKELFDNKVLFSSPIRSLSFISLIKLFSGVAADPTSRNEATKEGLTNGEKVISAYLALLFDEEEYFEVDIVNKSEYEVEDSVSPQDPLSIPSHHQDLIKTYPTSPFPIISPNKQCYQTTDTVFYNADDCLVQSELLPSSNTDSLLIRDTAIEFNSPNSPTTPLKIQPDFKLEVSVESEVISHSSMSLESTILTTSKSNILNTEMIDDIVEHLLNQFQRYLLELEIQDLIDRLDISLYLSMYSLPAMIPFDATRELELPRTCPRWWSWYKSGANSSPFDIEKSWFEDLENFHYETINCQNLMVSRAKYSQYCVKRGETVKINILPYMPRYDGLKFNQFSKSCEIKNDEVGNSRISLTSSTLNSSLTPRMNILEQGNSNTSADYNIEYQKSLKFCSSKDSLEIMTKNSKDSTPEENPDKSKKSMTMLTYIEMFMEFSNKIVANLWTFEAIVVHWYLLAACTNRYLNKDYNIKSSSRNIYTILYTHTDKFVNISEDMDTMNTVLLDQMPLVNNQMNITFITDLYLSLYSNSEYLFHMILKSIYYRIARESSKTPVYFDSTFFSVLSLLVYHIIHDISMLILMAHPNVAKSVMEEYSCFVDSLSKVLIPNQLKIILLISLQAFDEEIQHNYKSNNENIGFANLRKTTQQNNTAKSLLRQLDIYLRLKLSFLDKLSNIQDFLSLNCPLTSDTPSIISKLMINYDIYNSHNFENNVDSTNIGQVNDKNAVLVESLTDYIDIYSVSGNSRFKRRINNENIDIHQIDYQLGVNVGIYPSWLANLISKALFDINEYQNDILTVQSLKILRKMISKSFFNVGKKMNWPANDIESEHETKEDFNKLKNQNILPENTVVHGVHTINEATRNKYASTDLNAEVVDKDRLSRISSIYIPFITCQIIGAVDRIENLSVHDPGRKELLAVLLSILQGLSDKLLREWLRYLYNYDHEDNSPEGVWKDSHDPLKLKRTQNANRIRRSNGKMIFNLLRVLHLCMDTFEYPNIMNSNIKGTSDDTQLMNGKSTAQKINSDLESVAKQLLAPDISLHHSSSNDSVRNQTDTIAAPTQICNNSHLIPPTSHSTLKDSESIKQTSTQTQIPLDDLVDLNDTGLDCEIGTNHKVSGDFGSMREFKDDLTVVSESLNQDVSTSNAQMNAVSSDSIQQPAIAVMSSYSIISISSNNIDKVVDLTSRITTNTALLNDSNYATGNNSNNLVYVNNTENELLQCATEVSISASVTVLRTIQLMLEECSLSYYQQDVYLSECSTTMAPNKIIEPNMQQSKPSETSNELLPFIQEVLRVLLHSLFIHNSVNTAFDPRIRELTVMTLSSASWVIRSLGYPLFVSAVGNSLQDWLHKCLTMCYHNSLHTVLSYAVSNGTNDVDPQQIPLDDKNEASRERIGSQGSIESTGSKNFGMNCNSSYANNSKIKNQVKSLNEIFNSTKSEHSLIDKATVGQKSFNPNINSDDRMVKAAEVEYLDVSSNFLGLLLYACFHYNGSISGLKHIFQAVSQDLVTTIINDDQSASTSVLAPIGYSRYYSYVNLNAINANFIDTLNGSYHTTTLNQKLQFISLSSALMRNSTAFSNSAGSNAPSMTKVSSLDMVARIFDFMFRIVTRSCVQVSLMMLQGHPSVMHDHTYEYEKSMKSKTNEKSRRRSVPSSMSGMKNAYMSLAFESSVNNCLDSIRIIVKAYSYIIRQIGVDRIVQYNYDGMNMFDSNANPNSTAIKPIMSHLTSNNNNGSSSESIDDVLILPILSQPFPQQKYKAISPLKIDYHQTIELLVQVSDIFNALILPRFHIYWLENLASIHDIYGNHCESALVRLKIYYICMNVHDHWESLWSPYQPLVWPPVSNASMNHASNSTSQKLQLSNKAFLITLLSLRQNANKTWRTWDIYRDYIQNILKKSISILSSAYLIKWEQKVSSELIKFYHRLDKIQMISEEYIRLGGSIHRAVKNGMDKFSVGNFYRVYYLGTEIPDHLNNKTFVYRDSANMHISEFQDMIKESLQRLLIDKTVITIGNDSNDLSLYTNLTLETKPNLKNLFSANKCGENELAMLSQPAESEIPKAMIVLSYIQPILSKSKSNKIVSSSSYNQSQPPYNSLSSLHVNSTSLNNKVGDDIGSGAIVGEQYIDLSYQINEFKYEIPFTINPKRSHAATMDEQYKKKVILTVKESFPSIYVRQQVIDKSIQTLNPIEVAIDDFQERISEMTVFLQMKTIHDSTILREMMRIIQGSIMPQVNAGAAEVARIFLSNSSKRSQVEDSVNTDNNAHHNYMNSFYLQRLRETLRIFLLTSFNLLKKIKDCIEKATISTDALSKSNYSGGNNPIIKDDLSLQWLEEMYKAYSILHEKIVEYSSDIN